MTSPLAPTPSESVSDHAADHAADSASTLEPASERLRAAKILVVERELSLRSALVEALREPKTCRLYEASGSAAALQILKALQIDILVVGQLEEAVKGQHNELKQWLRGALPRVKRCVRLFEERAGWLGEGAREEAPWSELTAHAFKSALQTPPLTPTLPLIAETPSTEVTTEGDPSTSPIAPRRVVTAQEESPKGEVHYPPLSEAPRPKRPAALTHILSLTQEAGALHRQPKRAAPIEQSQEEGAQALWVGPLTHELIDDLKRVCEALSLKLVLVESAQAALHETRQRRFELAFVYHQLQDMFSLSLVRALRREIGDSFPVAYVGHAQVSDRLEGVHAGVSLFLKEQVSVDLLTQATRQLRALNTKGSAKVLVIDDDKAQLIDHVAQCLKQSTFQLSSLTSPLRVLEYLSEVQVDLLIINADMLGLGGFEVCRTLRATPEWQAIPIVLIGERIDDEIKVASYRAGADDYLPSHADQSALKACLESRLERSRVVRERADRDGLTGLLLRRAFNDALATRLATARRQGSCVSVCLFDLDHFKSINDTYGHVAGDRVLTAVGRLLSSSFRVEDLRGRWGGEEFVVAFSDEEAESAKVILDRARREFVRFIFEGDHGERFQASFSAGIATYPKDGQSIEDLFKVADERLYKVKEAGRNRILAADDFSTEERSEIASQSTPTSASTSSQESAQGGS